MPSFTGPQIQKTLPFNPFKPTATNELHRAPCLTTTGTLRGHTSHLLTLYTTQIIDIKLCEHLRFYSFKYPIFVAVITATVSEVKKKIVVLQIIYRVSRGECARPRENVPYVKVHRYNPKHLYPNLNGYGDNGERSLKV